MKQITCTCILPNNFWFQTYPWTNVLIYPNHSFSFWAENAVILLNFDKIILQDVNKWFHLTSHIVRTTDSRKWLTAQHLWLQAPRIKSINSHDGWVPQFFYSSVAKCHIGYCQLTHIHVVSIHHFTCSELHVQLSWITLYNPKVGINVKSAGKCIY